MYIIRNPNLKTALMFGNELSIIVLAYLEFSRHKKYLMAEIIFKNNLKRRILLSMLAIGSVAQQIVESFYTYNIIDHSIINIKRLNN